MLEFSYCSSCGFWCNNADNQPSWGFICDDCSEEGEHFELELLDSQAAESVEFYCRNGAEVNDLIEWGIQDILDDLTALPF